MRQIVLFVLLFKVFLLSAQEEYYTAPVKFPIFLSGSFAELRSNHYHSGIDIKTLGVIGQPIYSVAEGYISRISVSPSGFGKALYVNHPNGTTSVYAHLESFRYDIDVYIKNLQYEQEVFKIDVDVPAEKFNVKQGEQIALSGNTGSSGGPHLHFEIRDTETEEPLNPLKYNFNIQDQIDPKIYALQVVPISEDAHIRLRQTKARYTALLQGKKYGIKESEYISAFGRIGFSLETNDFFDGSHNRCGIVSMETRVNGEVYFSYQLDRFSFDETRYINSHIDYENFIELKRRFQKTWVEPGNKFRGYKYVKGDGTLLVEDKKNYRVEIEVKDFYGNASRIEFEVRGIFNPIEKTPVNFQQRFNYSTENTFSTENLKLEIPEGALYTDVYFEFGNSPKSSSILSPKFSLHKNTTPLHKSAILKIKADVPESLQEKVLLVAIDDKTGRYWASGGEYKNGWVEGEIRTFGTYTVKADTIKPTIKPLSISNGSLTESNRIRFIVSDDLAGIKTIEGKLDGKWMLFDWDAKTSTIVHYFDKQRFEFNKRHAFELRVSDYTNNTAVYESSFWK